MNPDITRSPDVDEEEEFPPRPDVSHLITEDDTPVDNQFSEKQMRLLTESLYASWKPGFPFIAMANVGVYVALNRPCVVPDVLVKTHVQPHKDLMEKDHRAYMSWTYDGKPPEIVIEIVSNAKGGELSTKHRNYEHLGVSWYAVFDPAHAITGDTLTFFALKDRRYEVQAAAVMPELGLRLAVWEGEFEGVTAAWLRWTLADGTLLLTGQERAAALEEKLRKAGLDPDKL